ncbi:ankyrin repeat domain-containing protein, partial [Aspergillus ruber CBS 135680]
TPMMWASIHGYRDVVGILLQHGANPNAKDLNGRTPLVCAAEYSRVDIIRRLLECGAEFDNRDAYSGRTPLSLASQYGYTAVVRPLLQQGADPNSKD